MAKKSVKQVIKTKPVEKAKSSQTVKPAASTSVSAKKTSASKPVSGKATASRTSGTKSVKNVDYAKTSPNASNTEVGFWHTNRKSAKSVSYITDHVVNKEKVGRSAVDTPSKGHPQERTSATKTDKTKKTVAMRRKGK